MRNAIFVGLIILFILQLWVRIYSYQKAYLTPFNAAYWQQRYNESQWAPKPACVLTDPHINPKTCVWDDNYYTAHKNVPFHPDITVPIGDDGLYTYAGYAYITGHDPTTLNAEIPPLGKYIIGIFIVLFHNQNLFALFSGLLVLVAFFLLNLTIFKDKLLAFIPVLLFSFEPLFYTQLRAPFLDTFYLSFLLLTFFFFLRKNYIPAGICLGCMVGVKASSSTFVLVLGTMALYILLTKSFSQIKKALLVIPFALLVFMATYIRYFLLGHSIRQFLEVQKYIIAFYANGAKPDALNALQMLLLGKWSVWWQKTPQHIQEWSLAWSLLLIMFIIYCLYSILRKQVGKTTLLAVWIIIYLALFVVVPVWPRYLLLVLPFMYNLTVWLLSKSIGSRFWQSRLPSSTS